VLIGVNDAEETAMAADAAQQQHEETYWERLYGAIDGCDATVVDRLFTDDATLQFNYHPPVIGRDAVRGAMEHFWSTVAAMRHTFRNVIEQGDRAVIEATCTYTRHDGVVVALPVATVCERRGDRVSAQRIYIDMAPLESPELLEH
jgi:ketosteroid isomerase-like protein